MAKSSESGKTSSSNVPPTISHVSTPAEMAVADAYTGKGTNHDSPRYTMTSQNLDHSGGVDGR